MSAWSDEVARHRGHILRFRDDTRLDCRECARPILLPLRADLAETPVPLTLHASDACTLHPGQRKGACGGCRADTLVEPPPPVPPPPTPDEQRELEERMRLR